MTQTTTEALFVRVRLIGEVGGVDVALPLRRPIAQFVSAVFDGVVLERPGVPLRLYRLGGEPFDGNLTLADHAVVDGEVLYLLPRDRLPEPAVYDDVVERVAEETDGAPGRWTARSTRHALLSAALSAAALLAVVLVAPTLVLAGSGEVVDAVRSVTARLEVAGSRTWILTAALAGVVFAVVGVVRWRSPRTAQVPPLAAAPDDALLAGRAVLRSLVLLGLLLVALATAQAALPLGIPDAVAVTGAVLLVIAALAAWAVPVTRWVCVGAALLAATAGVVGWVVSSGPGASDVVPVAAVVWLVLVGLAQRLAALATGLFARASRGSLVVLEADTADLTRPGRGVSAALCAAGATTAAAAGAFLVTGDRIDDVLASLLAAVLVLRTRRFAFGDEVRPLLAAGLAVAGMLVLDWVLVPEGWARTGPAVGVLALAAAATAAAAVGWRGSPPTPRTERWIDRVEGALLLAILPVLAGALGFYGWVGDLARAAGA